LVTKNEKSKDERILNQMMNALDTGDYDTYRETGKNLRGKYGDNEIDKELDYYYIACRNLQKYNLLISLLSKMK